MTEILFYHLQRQPIERVLPALLEKSIERSWRVVVQAGSEERIEALDAHLWTYREGSFLPHGTWREPEAAQQPILLTINDENPNGASVRFKMPDWTDLSTACDDTVAAVPERIIMGRLGIVGQCGKIGVVWAGFLN